MECLLNQKDELFSSKFVVWKSGDLGECKHMEFRVDLHILMFQIKGLSSQHHITCPQKIVATFKAGNSIKTFTTILNPFPFDTLYLKLYPKEYDTVKEVQFHMKDLWNAQGTVKVGLRQLNQGLQWCRTVEKTIKRGHLGLTFPKTYFFQLNIIK